MKKKMRFFRKSMLILIGATAIFSLGAKADVTVVGSVPDFGTGLSITELDTSCPSPTVKRGDTCILNSDVQLTRTLSLASRVTLDCKNHVISPGTGDAPEVGLLLHLVNRVDVKNCTIYGFDFGVAVIGGSMNSFTGNSLLGRDYGVYLIESSHNELANNVIGARNGFGAALAMYGDSDANGVINNVIRLAPNAGENPFNEAVARVPTGAKFDFPQSSVVVGTFQAGTPRVLNLMIDGNLTQIILAPDDLALANTIDGNSITVAEDYSEQQLSSGIWVGAGTSNTKLNENSIVGGGTGVQTLTERGTDGYFQTPGSCESQAAVACEDPAYLHPFFAIGDVCPAGSPCLGTSSVFIEPQALSSTANALSVTDNELSNQVYTGLEILKTRNAVVRSNDVVSSSIENFGILVGFIAIESAVVQGNTVDSHFPLVLAANTSEFFGAVISDNSFTADNARPSIFNTVSEIYPAQTNGNCWLAESGCRQFNQNDSSTGFAFGGIGVVPIAGDCAAKKRARSASSGTFDRPVGLEELCDFDAPYRIGETTGPTGFTVVPSIHGALAALGHGPVAGEELPCIDSTAFPPSLPFTEIPCAASLQQAGVERRAIQPPPGTEHIHIELDSTSERDDLQALVFSLDEFGAVRLRGINVFDNAIDLACGYECESHVFFVDVYAVDVDDGLPAFADSNASTQVSVQAFYLTSDNNGLVVNAPASVEAGQPFNVSVAPPAGLSPGDYFYSVTIHADSAADEYFGDNFRRAVLGKYKVE